MSDGMTSAQIEMVQAAVLAVARLTGFGEVRIEIVHGCIRTVQPCPTYLTDRDGQAKIEQLKRGEE